MFFWIRELLGWLLLGVSLVMFYGLYTLLARGRWIEGGPFALVCIFVFRGAIQLLKVAVAARVCQQAQDRLYPVAEPTRAARPAPVRALPR